MKEVVIIGAGLSGLSAAYYLKQAGIKALVLEARPRYGGRILTLDAAGKATPIEMGATWFADKHTSLRQLLQELKLSLFKQYQSGLGVFESHQAEEVQLFKMPGTEEASFRVQGGTSTLLHALVEKVGAENIILNAPLSTISDLQSCLEIKTADENSYLTRNVIVTIPPYLIVSQKIEFNPPLPDALVQVMENTQTWMGESIKFAVEYERPFWREKGYAGAAFSNSGIIQEMYDHSTFDASCFALKGFLSVDAFALSKEEREEKVHSQLVRFFGPEAAQYLSYNEKMWREEEYTFAPYGKYMVPHQNNGHPIYSQAQMNNKLFMAGSEASPKFGGYMDGAVYNGWAAAQKILAKLKK